MQLTLLTVDFLSVFVPKHTVIIQLMLSDMDFVLGREGFRKRTSSFRHFGRKNVPGCVPTINLPHLYVAGKMQGKQEGPNHTHPLLSRENSEPIQQLICSHMIFYFFYLFSLLRPPLPSTLCCLHGLTQIFCFFNFRN